jgi:hypothetical protein
MVVVAITFRNNVVGCTDLVTFDVTVQTEIQASLAVALVQFHGGMYTAWCGVK